MADRRHVVGARAAVASRLTEALWRLAAPFGIVAFWGGMAAAAHAYPGGYDWRYQTISVLLYSDHNPRGYLWAWVGLELCALCGVAWTGNLLRAADAAAGGSSTIGLRLLQAGFACMCCAVLPDRLLPVPKGHEVLAIGAFLAVCTGVTQEMLRARASLTAYLPRAVGERVGVWIPAGIPTVPLALAGITQAYLALRRPHVPWVNPSWRTLGISPYLSFAVWEWVSCVLFSACLLLLWRRRRAERSPSARRKTA